MSHDRYCTVAEAAKILKLTEYTVRKKIREGSIKAIKTGSDREGYRIPYNDLIDYAKNNGRLDLNELAALNGPLGWGSFGTFFPTTTNFGDGISKIMNELKNNSTQKFNAEKIKELSIEGLKDEIEATQYYVQALELDGEELSKEDQKRILEAKAKIKILERQIKEIEIKYEFNKQ